MNTDRIVFTVLYRTGWPLLFLDYGYTVHREIFVPRFVIAPFALIVSGRVQDLTNSNNVPNSLCLNTTVSGQISNGGKLIASVSRRKNYLGRKYPCIQCKSP